MAAPPMTLSVRWAKNQSVLKYKRIEFKTLFIFLCTIIEVWGGRLLCRYWMNFCPSLFKLSLHKVSYGPYKSTTVINRTHPSGTPEFTINYSRVRVVQSLVFCVMFCKSYVVPFLLVIVLSAHFLRFTASDYLFDILDLRLLITSLVS
jgi:hypothetical protein